YYTTLFFSYLLSRQPTSPLFPYTTLFRSYESVWTICNPVVPASRTTMTSNGSARVPAPCTTDWLTGVNAVYGPRLYRVVAVDSRSEEHTSELQSRFDLVCRLLLEKKKIQN